jgi:hypothetical protein
VENKGLDVLEPTGFKAYKWLLTQWVRENKNILEYNKYIRDFNIYLYWLILTKDPFITYWYRNTGEMHRNKDMHVYEWLLSKDDFNKRAIAPKGMKRS